MCYVITVLVKGYIQPSTLGDRSVILNAFLHEELSLLLSTYFLTYLIQYPSVVLQPSSKPSVLVPEVS